MVKSIGIKAYSCTAFSLLGLLTIFGFFGCSIANERPQIVVTAGAAISKARDAWDSIGEKANWKTAFRKENIDRFEPYTATLVEGNWIVKGTIPKNYDGETLEATVRRSDGSVNVRVVVANTF